MYNKYAVIIRQGSLYKNCACFAGMRLRTPPGSRDVAEHGRYALDKEIEKINELFTRFFDVTKSGNSRAKTKEEKKKIHTACSLILKVKFDWPHEIGAE